ncbi:MAG: methionine/alanine import NSS transporter subunit MetS [Corynebacterium sp.]|uniref:methionine/alanine import NSS transporter subunit MetS n=1 Tax=Corynebacterium sp. TaxID=1720 RepID=UPI0026E021DD|nr:methionine/alanine import NSS transporter subunit MetS [Corynebacterium sp.]MDO5668581.1 methionine/alanine import NSS transporter subunit MetS [Corynebacterium sp.]
MSGIAIMMMVLFMVVIWGGFIASALHLRSNPDDTSGALGNADYARDEQLAAQEIP